PGIVGIVAARLLERFSVSAIACALHDGAFRGSARAAPGGDVHAALAAMRDLLPSWGGHKAAAGLEFAPESLASVREAFSAQTPRTHASKPDVEIAAHLQSAREFPTFDELLQLEPLGEGNPTPMFAITSVVESFRPVGQGGHLSLQVRV